LKQTKAIIKWYYIFNKGLILKAKKDIAGTNSFFGKFCKIWHKTLKKLVIKK
jgi:hypothetical protein